jgi:pyrroloquinoline quinone biosynthesis protein A
MLIGELCPARRAIVHPSRSHPKQPASGGSHAAISTDLGDKLMKWETPTACDFRFGFEITMYIAAR